MKQKLKTFLKKDFPVFIGVFVGAVGGYLYYRFVGCASGVCAITSNPYISTFYGGVIGGLLGSLFKTQKCCACATGKREEDHHE